MIVVLHGPEEYLREERLAAIVAEIPAEEREASRVDLAGAGLTPDVLAANAQALPFFSTRRLVVVRGLLSRPSRGKTERTDWAAFAAILDAVPGATTVVLVEDDRVPDSQPLLKRRRPEWQVELFEKPRAGDLPGFVQRRARAKRIRLESGAVQLLVQAIGPDLRRIDLELEKLALYAADRAIAAADVELLVHEAGQQTIFQLADALVEGRRGQAINLLRGLIDRGTEPEAIVPMLAGQLRTALHTRRLADAGSRIEEIQSALGVPSRYPIQKALQQGSRVSREHLETLYRRLLDLDWRFKTGQSALDTDLDLFVLIGLPESSGARSPRRP